jgi:CrcB protein
MRQIFQLERQKPSCSTRHDFSTAFCAKQISGRSMAYLVVFLGGGLGAALRHAVNVVAARWFGLGFPVGTLAVNVTGSIIMGLLAGYFAFKGGPSQSWRLFMTTGILGGYTTFSAFSLDVALLYERGEVILAVAYVVASVLLAVGGLFAGLALVRHFT